VQLLVAQALVREARVQVVQVQVLVALPREARVLDDQAHKAGPHRPTPSSA
jgi:hypothetical protein